MEDRNIFEGVAGHWIPLKRVSPDKENFHTLRKQPAGAWRHRSLTAAEAWEQLNTNGVVGAVPGSSDLVAVDVDSGDIEEVYEAIGDSCVQVKTPNGYHLLYLHPGEPVPNKKWSLPSSSSPEASGDIRGDSGYVVLWQPWKFMEAVERREELNVFRMEKFNE